MSDKNILQVTENPNEWINWIEETISNKNIKYYEYKNFRNIEKIDNCNFKNVSRANWKNSEKYFVLKSYNFDNTTVKEIIHEFELHREVNFHKNFISFFGITDQEDQNGQMKKYLVMDYADSGSLQNYLKENFKNLTWEDKYKLAYQLTCAVTCLHDKGIVLRVLHSGNILIHQNIIKLADFGLSERIKEISNQSNLFDIVPYIDPKRLTNLNNNNNSYSLNEKSDVYSIGVILWEISSGQSPFDGDLFDASLITQILQGYRETIVSNTLSDYSDLYTECWNGEPDNRPAMNQVVIKLKVIITKTNATIECYQTDNYNLISQLSNINLDNIDTLNINNPLHEPLFKEIDPTTQNIYQSIFEEDLNIVVDELVNIYFKELNKGKEERIRNKHLLDNISNYKINLREIYIWLLNNQNNSNSIYLLGYFNYYGIEIDINKKKALELYQKAELKNNLMAQFDLACIYIYGNDVEKNYDKAFELFNKLAEEEYPSGINSLGYCYDCGIGTDVNMQKAFELYQIAANLGNSRAQCNLGILCEEGIGVDKDYNKAFELYEKSAEGEHSGGMNLLGNCYNNGIGTSIDKRKAFELYQKAANLENNKAQYNLALMYENGNGIKKDMNQAIYWYKKSAKKGNQDAQDKLNLFST